MEMEDQTRKSQSEQFSRMLRAMGRRYICKLHLVSDVRSYTKVMLWKWKMWARLSPFWVGKVQKMEQIMLKIPLIIVE